VQKQQVVGLDVGGATLKAFADGRAFARRFPLWRQPELLADALRELLPHHRPARIAVTMTGELCDCFPTKEAGVRHILDSVAAAFPTSEVLVWQTDDRFVSPDQAKSRPLQTAASNFLALAWAASLELAHRTLLLIDVGSTTVDLLPILYGKPQPAGRTDRERLASGELVYQGVERTPVCSLVQELTLGGVPHSVMNELFALTLDAYLITGDLQEDPSETMTADGRPATKAAAIDRLARIVGADRSNFTDSDADEAARQIAGAQFDILRRAFQRAASWFKISLEGIVLAGQGEWLARRVIADVPELRNVVVLSLTERLGESVSRCACAYAVAKLAQTSAAMSDR
jgi:probable H4MPT-linked C1 transfer pathway protein